jgi:hypothetical protein
MRACSGLDPRNGLLAKFSLPAQVGAALQLPILFFSFVFLNSNKKIRDKFRLQIALIWRQKYFKSQMRGH